MSLTDYDYYDDRNHSANDYVDLHVLPPHSSGHSTSTDAKLVCIAGQHLRPVLQVVQILTSLHYFVDILLHYIRYLVHVFL